MKIQLGDFARDKVTGFEGVVIGRSRYLYNVDRLTLQPHGMKDGKTLKSCSFDEPGVEFVRKTDNVVHDVIKSAIKLGDIVQEPITGFEGTIVALTIWSQGCVVASVQPTGLHEGKPYDQRGIDLKELVLVKPVVVEEPRRRTGGPKCEPSTGRR